jgi:hypothetical protein
VSGDSCIDYEEPMATQRQVSYEEPMVDPVANGQHLMKSVDT